MESDDFERLVEEAIDALPALFRDRMDNVMILVEDWPDRGTLRSAGLTSPAQLLGFYHGVHQTGRTAHYGLVTPDKISIYRRPIEMRCRTAAELGALVTRVVHHEIAHHFGIDDDRLEEIGAY